MKARCAWIKPLLPFPRLPPASAIFGPVSLLTTAPRGDGTQSRNQSNEPPLRDSLLFKSDLMPLLSPTLPRDPKGGGFNWLVHNHIPELNIILPSEVLVSSDKRPYRNLAFHNVLARQGSSCCNRARLNFQAFALRDITVAARKGCRVGRKMSYRFSFC